MRIRMLLLACAVCLAAATPAYACNFYFASSFMRVPAKPSFGAGINGVLSDPELWAYSVDAAMRLGDHAVVQPAIGMCSFLRETSPFYGAGAAYRVSNNANMSMNIQSAISYMTEDRGSVMTIPIGAALSFKGSNTMSWYAGASVLWMQLDPAPPDASDTVSESDPVLFGGLNLASGPLSWTFGGQLVMGDETEFGIVIGAQMNQGVNAIRSLFRRK